MRKVLGNLQLALAFFIIVFLFFFLGQNIEFLKKITLFFIICILLLNLFFYLCISLPFTFYVPHLTLSKAIYMNLKTTLLNYVLPFRGGVVVRGMFFKKWYDFDYKDYIFLSIRLSLYALIVLYISLMIASVMNFSIHKFFVMFTYLGLVSFLLLAVSYQITKDIKFKGHSIRDFFSLYSLHSIYSYVGSVLSYSFRLFLLFSFFDIQLSYSQAFAVSILTSCIGLISLLPGNIGLKEVSIVGVLYIFGVDHNTGLFIAAFDRFIQVLSAGLLYLIFTLLDRIFLCFDAKKDLSL